MNLGQLRTRVKSEGGFDVTDAQVDLELNVRYTDLVAQARWHMAEVTVGTVVNGTAAYDLPSGTVDIEGLRVGDGEYGRVGTRDLWALTNGRREFFNPRSGFNGVFAPEYKSDGTVQVKLFPTPDSTVAGAALTVLASQEPAPLVNDTDVPGLPTMFHPKIASGAIASFLARVDERQDEASYWEQEYSAAVTDLKRYKNRRVGSGPTQIRVVGVGG